MCGRCISEGRLASDPWNFSSKYHTSERIDIHLETQENLTDGNKISRHNEDDKKFVSNKLTDGLLHLSKSQFCLPSRSVVRRSRQSLKKKKREEITITTENIVSIDQLHGKNFTEKEEQVKSVSMVQENLARDLQVAKLFPRPNAFSRIVLIIQKVLLLPILFKWERMFINNHSDRWDPVNFPFA